MNSEARGMYEHITKKVLDNQDIGLDRLITNTRYATELALEQCILALWDDCFWVEHKKLNGKVYFKIEWN